MKNRKVSVRRLAALGLMLAMITVLSALEHMLPPLPMLPPGVRLGLSNVVTMYAIFFMGGRSAALLTVLKSLFVLLTRGAAAGFLSLCGGMLSIAVILLLTFLFKDRISYLVLSVAGAIFHNLGQIAGASLLLGSNMAFFYLPVLLISGVLMGSVTGALLRAVMPLLHKAADGLGTRNR